VARLQQVGGLLGLGAVSGVAVWSAVSADVSPLWVLLPLLWSPALLAFQGGLALWVNSRPEVRQTHPGVAIGLAGTLRAWLSELPVSAAVFGWRQPWRWRTHPDVGAPAPESAPAFSSSPSVSAVACPRGVLLVHGYLCNRGLWNRWLPVLAQRGHAVVALNLEPVFGSIDEYAPLLDEAITRLTQATGRPPLVVAHSMGGLAVRAWMRAHPGADQRVVHVVTIGTPNQGTWLARWGQGRNARQMRQQSDWLQTLARAEPPLRSQRFTCWHSSGDNIVFPLGTAVLPGSQTRHLPDVGHVALVDHPEVMAHTLVQLSS
jgi:pimeloyl-ACP methyl ester carboxylesterase